MAHMCVCVCTMCYTFKGNLLAFQPVYRRKTALYTVIWCYNISFVFTLLFKWLVLLIVVGAFKSVQAFAFISIISHNALLILLDPMCKEFSLHITSNSIILKTYNENQDRPFPTFQKMKDFCSSAVFRRLHFFFSAQWREIRFYCLSDSHANVKALECSTNPSRWIRQAPTFLSQGTWHHHIWPQWLICR